MKIAVITDDVKTISAYLGSAQYYLVFTVENSEIAGQELRFKANYNRFAGHEQGIAQIGLSGNHHRL